MLRPTCPHCAQLLLIPQHLSLSGALTARYDGESPHAMLSILCLSSDHHLGRQHPIGIDLCMVSCALGAPLAVLRAATILIIDDGAGVKSIATESAGDPVALLVELFSGGLIDDRQQLCRLGDPVAADDFVRNLHLSFFSLGLTKVAKWLGKPVRASIVKYLG